MAPSLEVQREELRRLLDRAGLPVEALLERVRAGARMIASDAPPGRTRLCGRPAVPAGAQWPVFDGRPLLHVARIDLDELAAVLAERHRQGLPATGDLWLWTDALGAAWGFRPEDRGSFVVRHTAGGHDEREGPLGRDLDGDPFPTTLPGQPCALVPELVLPDIFEDGMEELLDEEQAEAYDEVAEALEDTVCGTAPLHRVLGAPALIQGPMELECQLASNGIDVGEPSGADSPRARELEAGSGEWTLLAQIDSDDDLGLMWGDVGRVYWWLRRKDLAAGAWDAVWGILQCT
jgi:uncharacterized protein YwqG